MNNHGGFILRIDEEQRAQAIKDYIERNNTFTDTLSAPDWKTRKFDLFLVSLGMGSIHFAALARSGSRVATQKVQIRFSNIIHFGPPIPISEIQPRLQSRIKQYFIRSSSGMGGHVPPSTWHNLIGIIKQLRPDSAQDLDILEKLRQLTPDLFNKPGVEIITHERDAINIALRISGINPIEITKWISTEGSTAPFLKGLSSVRLIEDQMIAHDAQVFGDWRKIRDCQVGTVEFVYGSERLTIMNVNRHSVEHNLGIDLLYYFHKHRSYVMVQYKRMIKEGSSNEYRYRPTEENYESELSKMCSFSEHLISKTGKPSLPDYRFHPGMFYFKFCPAEIFEPMSTEMIYGMYLPLDYWTMLVDSPKILGPRGGKRITFDNVERRFSNTLFIELVKAGWIGSQVTDEDLIANVIQDSLRTGKSVLLASFVNVYNTPQKLDSSLRWIFRMICDRNIA